MRFFIAAVVMMTIGFLGGCQMEEDPGTQTQTNQSPDVRAFNDHFTKNFLHTSKSSLEGYYVFESATGNYTMDFPAEGIIGEESYSIRDKESESFQVGIENDDGTASSLSLRYDKYKKEENYETYLENIKQSMELSDITFEEASIDGQTFYIGYYERKNGQFGYAAYIQNNHSSGGITVINMNICEADHECSNVKDTRKEEIVKWIKSIHFTN